MGVGFRISTLWVAVSCFLVCFCWNAGWAKAQEGAPDQLSKEQLDRWSKIYSERASGYELKRSDDQSRLVMHPGPVTRWTNLVVSPDLTHGECFVWTHEGRPEAFVSLFSYNKQGRRTVAHAWNLLSNHPLEATDDGNVFWTPQPDRTVQMKRVPNSPVVAESRGKRLVQMRGIARAFTARSGGTDGNKELALRRLATPVYRFARESKEAIDGGLFAFVTGTDPEVLLLLEAKRQDDDRRWSYQLFRHSHLTLIVQHNGVEVWRSLRGSPQLRESTGEIISAIERPYRSQHGVDSQPLMLP